MSTPSRLRRFAALAILGLSLGPPAFRPAAAGEAHLYLAPYLQQARLTGDAMLTGGEGPAGTQLDLEETLGVDPEQDVRGVDGFFKLAGSRIEFSYAQAAIDERSRLAEQVIINGTTFAADERIDSEIDLTRYKLMYGFDFSFKVVNVGFLVGGHLIDVEAVVESSSGALEEQDLRVPIPVVGATLGIHPVSRLAIHAEVSGFSATVSGVEATLLDGFAGVDVLFIPKLGVSLGYRYFAFDAEDEDEQDAVDITQRGPYVGLALHL
ncbi:MAG TPA: hypothetical protein VJV23_10725 [Candidatus Polarisedimenticolia bacterium]|nr:hypothetical protein [Candidatus Polarisedimenticolia bacterium]